MLSVSCGFRVCVILFRKKEKYYGKTLKMWFPFMKTEVECSPRAQPWLL